MSSTRMIVDPPGFTPRPYSLASVVEWRDGDRHWQAGVEWQATCGDTGTTYDECVVIGATSGSVTGSPVPFPEPGPKESTAARQTFGATPFTVYAEVDCSAVGFYEDSTEIVLRKLREQEALSLESVFSTGTVDGTTLAQFPHLASDVPIGDLEENGNSVTLQLASTPVTGTAVCVELALGLLEAALADCYGGTGIIHVPTEVLPLLAEAFLIERAGDRLMTTGGNTVVVGAGYAGAGPAGVFDPAVRWIYATPPVFGYRSDVRTFERETTLDRSVNTVKAVAERNYLLGYDCCLFAAPVSMTCG